ncbi:vomeronasal type-2 receptor 116-like [Mesocricetus auratus]|uniref:Vomeronasal type-2 receptor 116-like n=1 Tax=Mesocricetus auratus TaxID=10036 RepID=A0ABM2XXI1_MESAU|nr:vomeronasal type-2 receptor 116-like [Mesocricetus auratus]
MMLPWIFTFCLLQTPVCLCLFSDSQCIRSMQHGLYHDGNVLIAGFVPLYSYHSNPRGNFEANSGRQIHRTAVELAMALVAAEAVQCRINQARESLVLCGLAVGRGGGCRRLGLAVVCNCELQPFQTLGSGGSAERSWGGRGGGSSGRGTVAGGAQGPRGTMALGPRGALLLPQLLLGTLQVPAAGDAQWSCAGADCVRAGLLRCPRTGEQHAAAVGSKRGGAGRFLENNYLFVLALLFATEEINRNPHLLPNISLGFDLYNALNNEWNVLQDAFIWLTGQRRIIPNYTCRRESKVAAVLTGTSSATSSHIGRLLDLYKFPQLTFGSFDAILSDRGQFSSLYQIASPDTSLPFGIALMMAHFNWTWVGLVLTDDHKASQILSDLRGEMDRNKVCIAFAKMIPDTQFLTLNSLMKTRVQILESLTNVIIIYGDYDSLKFLIFTLSHTLLTMKVWVLKSRLHAPSYSHSHEFLVDSFHAGLIFSHHHAKIPGFKHFMQTVNPFKYPEDNFLAILWHQNFNCSFSQHDCKIVGICLPNASLEQLPKKNWEMGMTEESYNIYNSVYAVAHSLHEMMFSQVQIQSPRNVEGNVYPWQLHPFLKNTHIKNCAGDNVVLDLKRKVDAEYDILNFWSSPRGIGLTVQVGRFSPKSLQGQQLILSQHMIKWPTGLTEIPRSVCSESCGPGFRKSPQEGKPNCCFDCTTCPANEISNETDMDHCVRCPESHYANTEQNHCLQKTVTFLAYEDPLGMTLTSLALGFSVLTASVLGVFVKYHHTPIVKANNRRLTYILLITLTFCFLCPLLFIGHPNTVTCILQQSTFAVLFTVALSTVLAKTLTVVLAFKVTVPGRIVRWIMTSRAPNFIIPICTIIQIVLCGFWLSTSPPFIDSDSHSEHGHIIIVCNKGSVVAFHCVLGYLCCLALGSYIMVYLSRNLPDTFNEAKFLSFSMLVFFTVWITFLPVYHSTQGNFMVAMEVFSILVSSAGFLGCIFVPKCYIILSRPDRNFLHHIRNKGHSKRNVLQT